MDLKKFGFAVLALRFLFCFQMVGCVRLDSEAVHTLVEMGKEEKGKEEALAQDDQSFKNLRKAIRRRKLKEDLSRGEVVKRFGEPVAVFSEDKGERWLYESKKGGWFTVPKIYLYFDENNQLKKWICIRTDCETGRRHPKR